MQPWFVHAAFVWPQGSASGPINVLIIQVGPAWVSQPLLGRLGIFVRLSEVTAELLLIADAPNGSSSLNIMWEREPLRNLPEPYTIGWQRYARTLEGYFLKLLLNSEDQHHSTQAIGLQIWVQTLIPGLAPVCHRSQFAKGTWSWKRSWLRTVDLMIHN